MSEETFGVGDLAVYVNLPAGTVLAAADDERHQIVLREDMRGNWASAARVRRSDGRPYLALPGWSGCLRVASWRIVADPRPATPREAYEALTLKEQTVLARFKAKRLEASR